MSHKVFVTKRRSALPTDAGAMADKPWFNMWQHQLWPYNDLEEGVTLYWYDNAEQAIVWQSPGPTRLKSLRLYELWLRN